MVVPKIYYFWKEIWRSMPTFWTAFKRLFFLMMFTQGGLYTDDLRLPLVININKYSGRVSFRAAIQTKFRWNSDNKKVPQMKLPQPWKNILEQCPQTTLLLHAIILILSSITPKLPQRSTYLQTRVNWHSSQGCHRCNHVHLALLLLLSSCKYMNRKLVKRSQKPYNWSRNQSISHANNWLISTLRTEDTLPRFPLYEQCQLV